MDAVPFEDWRHAGFGLYIHWPFCQSKCPYCDFNSHVATRIDQARWLRAFELEIDRIGALTQGRILNTVFFGGGTPSLMEAATVQGILDRIRATWTLANDIEITLEANPGTFERARCRASCWPSASTPWPPSLRTVISAGMVVRAVSRASDFVNAIRPPLAPE